LIQIGKNIISFSSVESTNTLAIELINKERPEEGTVILSEFQKSGRGQRDTSWESEHGENLLMSFIFYPDIEVTDHFLFNQCITLSVHDMIEKELSKSVAIKWPNDILVDDKKIAGILIENSISGNRFQYAVAGIGINVNQIRFKKYTPEATSLYLETQTFFNIHDVLYNLSRYLSKWYTFLNEKKFDLIRSSYLKFLFRKDALFPYEIKGKEISATIKGVSEDGRLLMQEKDGQTFKLNTKEVKYVF
jgi:BirA family biotin operon repressor/biotin-[acetyl-CoA-carboxylase] ligase